MTSESQSLTEPWVEDTGMKYAYAYDKGAKLMGKVGATGYPSAVLVDPSGNVAWMGHPSSLNASIVEPVLEGALAKPLWEWPKEADKVAKALKKRALGDALGEAIELGEGGTQIRATIEKLIAGKLASLKAARDEGDWLRVDTLGDELEDSFKGLPQREEVEVIVDALKKDKEAQDILKAQRKVAKIFSDDIKRKQIDKFEKDLTKIVEDYSGTAAERDARAGLEELEKLRRAYANR